MQDSLKVENTPTCLRREHNVSGTTQAFLLAKFKATQERHHHIVYNETLIATHYII